MARAQFFFAALALAAALPLAAAEEPEAVYAKFHRALVNEDLEEMLQHGTDAQRAELAGMSAAQKKASLKMMAMLMPHSYALRSKNVNPDGQGARLHLTGMGKPLIGAKPEALYGTAQMVLQRGAWKVASVEWNNRDPGVPAQAAPARPAPAAAATPAAKPAVPPAAKAAAAAPQPAPQKSTARQRSTLPVGAMDSAPERKLGTQKPACVYKPVMTAEDLEACR